MVIADTVATLRLYNPVISNIAYALNSLGRMNHPEVADLLPFRSGWSLQVHGDDDWYIARMVNNPGSDDNFITQLDSGEVADVLEKLRLFDQQNPTEIVFTIGKRWHEHFSTTWYGQDRFTYVSSKHSPPREVKLWNDIAAQLACWLDLYLLPQLHKIHKLRVARGLPEPVTYNLSEITNALWVLECEETCKQGTAFMLESVGLVTCEHVVEAATHAFKADAPSKKYPVEVITKHKIIDLAVLRIEVTESQALKCGNSDNIQQLDQIAVARFPNYRIGDSGSIATGHVSGFRTVSGIRRILANAPVIAGNSGGPVLSSNGKVIGVAVTGAERMEEFQETENHGIIPINALNLVYRLEN